MLSEMASHPKDSADRMTAEIVKVEWRRWRIAESSPIVDPLPPKANVEQVNASVPSVVLPNVVLVPTVEKLLPVDEKHYAPAMSLLNVCEQLRERLNLKTITSDLPLPAYHAPKLHIPVPVSVPPPVAEMLPHRSEIRVPNSEVMRANKVLELQRRCTEEINAQLPIGSRVMAWPLIPTAVWERENATFMMIACDFFSASAANTLLLPVSGMGGAQLKLPQHPLYADQSLVREAKLKVSRLQTSFAAEHYRVRDALARGEYSVLDQGFARKQKYIDALKALALELGNLAFGKTAMANNKELFQAALNY